MKELRLLGSMIKKLCEEKHVCIENELSWTKDQAAAVFDGRVFPSFPELNRMAELFGVPVSEILQGDEAFYGKNVVHCMGAFENPENREKILDIIDDYLVLMDAIH